MSSCWAENIGGCNGKISREHVVSKSLFISSEISVQGFYWCEEEPKIIGIESLTAKILCREHNSLLSPLDSAAGEAFDALRQQTKLSNDRAKFPSSTLFKVERFKIDAPLLERWFLKTLLNFSCGGNYFIGPDGTEKGVVPNELVRICYGLNPFPGSSGMYVAANSGMPLNMVDTVSFSPLINDKQKILGGFFEFRGVKFLLALMPEGLKFPLWSIPGIDPGWANAQLMHRFKKINIKHGKYLSHVVEFHW